MTNREIEMMDDIQGRLFVTGSTGELGRLVIMELLKRVPASHIVAGVRSLEHEVAKQFASQGVEIRLADYSKPETLIEAFKGIERVLLISSSADEARLAQHENVIIAAKAAKVGQIVYTSLLHADTSVLGFGDDHRRTEEFIINSGVPHVLLRHGWYIENHIHQIPTAIKYGVVFGCAGEGRFSTASRGDFAEAASIVLTSEGHSGHTYELAGDESYTLADFANAISEAAHIPVAYNNMVEAEYKRMLVSMKLPESIAELIADADSGALRGELEDNGKQLSSLIGHPTTDWRKAVKQAIASNVK